MHSVSFTGRFTLKTGYGDDPIAVRLVQSVAGDSGPVIQSQSGPWIVLKVSDEADLAVCKALNERGFKYEYKGPLNGPGFFQRMIQLFKRSKSAPLELPKTTKRKLED